MSTVIRHPPRPRGQRLRDATAMFGILQVHGRPSQRATLRRRVRKRQQEHFFISSTAPRAAPSHRLHRARRSRIPRRDLRRQSRDVRVEITHRKRTRPILPIRARDAFSSPRWARVTHRRSTSSGTLDDDARDDDDVGDDVGDARRDAEAREDVSRDRCGCVGRGFPSTWRPS